MRWLEVSLTVHGEVAEAVADVFARHAPGGVAMLAGGGDERSDTEPGPITVCAYLPLDQEVKAKQGRIEEGLWHLSQIHPLPQLSCRRIQEQDWTEAWKKSYRPIQVGRRLLVQPAWLPPKRGPRLPIVIDPGMAFGIGSHPSTRLCLEAMEEHLVPGSTVVDLGCGSGILSIAAARLGAISVLGLDIDPIAVQAARINVERNRLSDRVRVERGSLAELQEWHGKTGTRPTLLVANILARVLEQLLEQGLASSVEAGGKLILSGILEDQADRLMAVAQGKGLGLQDKQTMKDWIALVLQSKSPPKQGGDPTFCE